MKEPRTLPLGEIADVLRSAGLLREVRGAEDAVVSGVAQDSRAVREGDLFLAWVGVEVDAHGFVADAAAAGAAAAVVERAVDADLPQLVVTDGRRAGALAADRMWGSPWRELQIAAITGTNGKTTTALLLRHLLASAGRPAAALGTLGVVGPDGRPRPQSEGLTTPGPVEMTRRLASFVDEGVLAVAMEASSHALAQRRLDALGIGVAVFTNLTQDHLDYHADFEDYRSAKLRLLELLVDDGVAVVNADQPAWADVRAPAGRRTTSFGIDRPADLRAVEVELDGAGSAFGLVAAGADPRPVRLPLLGRFNVENALAAVAAAQALGVPLKTAADALADAPQVPGRLERVATEPCPVLIDFAHTPDALTSVLRTLRPLVRGRLIVLFGAGGDRDRGKRRPMAVVVSRHADLVLLTSDNPRTEDPERILDDLEAGLEGTTYEREADRTRAIGRALDLARPDDLVLLAGKGHETYQVVGTEKRPFDEREVVRRHMETR